ILHHEQMKYLFCNIQTHYATIHFGLLFVPLYILRCIVTPLRVGRSPCHHLRERGFNPEIVETTLAHKLPGVAGVYSHAQYREQRRAMLQDWADYLDSLVTEQVVIQANFRQAVN
ncbi:MAG: hypothetical protein LUQ11_10795, partial [Methylococcaceae bacterium]|nr:hypothetical protein [Methylococcaceae bacterium]